MGLLNSTSMPAIVKHPMWFRYHAPTKTADDTVRRLRFQVWSIILWHGRTKAEVLEIAGRKDWQRVERLWEGLLHHASFRLGALGSVGYILGLEFRPQIGGENIARLEQAAPLDDRTAGYFPQENEPQNPTKEGSES